MSHVFVTTNNELPLLISRCKDKDNFRNHQIFSKKNFQKPLFLTSVNNCTKIQPQISVLILSTIFSKECSSLSLLNSIANSSMIHRFILDDSEVVLQIIFIVIKFVVVRNDFILIIIYVLQIFLVNNHFYYGIRLVFSP